MGKHSKSPAKMNAKIKRSILRLLEYKQAYLEDCWDAEIVIDEDTKTIVWKASSLLNLTLKKNVKIVETRKYYHPEFPTKPISEKLAIFQNMWVPDQDSFNFFSCMHEHLKRNSTQCNNFCGQFSSPNCSRLATFLSINNWPTHLSSNLDMTYSQYLDHLRGHFT